MTKDELIKLRKSWADALDDVLYGLPDDHEPDLIELFESNTPSRRRIGDGECDE